MRRLCSLLGMPQHRFASIHVVGTNGKTSVTRMTAALLEAHGVRTGAYVSPHIRSWRERILIGGEPIDEQAFLGALERTEEAAKVADRSAGDEGPVTQFELVTAAAFVAFAKARVKIAVVEAGLGGRLDATNVLPSKLTVLTSIGLDHTEWLGETLEEIAAEKLAVLRDHTTLITGELPAEVEPVVRRATERSRARVVEPIADPGRESREQLQQAGTQEYRAGTHGYPASNRVLAEAAARTVLDRTAWREEAASGLELERSVPGRAEVSGGEPPLVFDAAHNPDGARALAQLLPDLVPDLEVICCLAVLSEKDAKGIAEALAPACSHFVCTEIPEEAIRGSGRPIGSSHPAEGLAELCRGTGAEAEAIRDPLQAWERARRLAREQGAAALAAGSHYLLAVIWTERPGPSY